MASENYICKVGEHILSSLQVHKSKKKKKSIPFHKAALAKESSESPGLQKLLPRPGTRPLAWGVAVYLASCLQQSC